MIKKIVTMSQLEYEDIKKAQKYQHAEVQKIWDKMLDGDVLLIDETETYVKTYRIYGDTTALILELPLWRIVRLKFKKKKVLAELLKMEKTIDVREYDKSE